MEKYRRTNGIQELEKELSKYNSKTCSFNKFFEYIQQRNIFKDKLNALNNQYKKTHEKDILEKYLQYNWYRFINKTRSEQNLINRIKEVYGPECILVMGDWSIPKQLKNFISTPGIGLKNRISKEIDIISLDEHNTSKLYYKTEKECDNLKLPIKVKPRTYNETTNKYEYINDKKKYKIKYPKRDKSWNLLTRYEKKGVRKEDEMNYLYQNYEKLIEENPVQEKTYKMTSIHAILTSQNGNNRMECLNRDKNAVYNMWKILQQWLKDRTRPTAYERTIVADQ